MRIFSTLTYETALQSAAKPSVANIDYSMLKNYLKKVALLILNIPFALGLLIILERRLQFDTPGYWVAKRAFGPRLGKDFGPMAWTSLGVDFILCFAVVWVLSLLCLGIIHEVER